MNTIRVNPLLLLCRLRSGSLGPPTLFFILHSKSNSHEGADLVSELFKYYPLNPPASLPRSNTFSLNFLEDWSLETNLGLERKYLNVFFNIFTNNQHPELQMQNRAEPGTATTVVNCYKRELELISDLTNRNYSEDTRGLGLNYSRYNHRYGYIVDVDSRISKFLTSPLLPLIRLNYTEHQLSKMIIRYRGWYLHCTVWRLINYLNYAFQKLLLSNLFLRE